MVYSHAVSSCQVSVHKLVCREVLHSIGYLITDGHHSVVVQSLEQEKGGWGEGRDRERNRYINIVHVIAMLYIIICKSGIYI